MTAEQEIRLAIRDRSPVRFRYAGGTRSRTVHPHVLFRTSTGRLCFDGVQTGGASRSGGLPGWRQFDLEEVSAVTRLEGLFTADPRYDPTGDKYSGGILASV